MGKTRIGDSRYEKRRNVVGGNSWMLRPGVGDGKAVGALREATTGLIDAPSKEEQEKSVRARKYVRSQRKNIDGLIYDIVGKRSDRLDVDSSTFEEGEYFQRLFHVSTWTASGSAVLDTPKGEIVLSYDVKREKPVRGLISTGNEDEVVLRYGDKPIKSLDDLNAALPDDLRDGLASLGLEPGSVGRRAKAEKKRIRAGKALARRNRKFVRESVEATFGGGENLTLVPDEYYRRFDYQGLYLIDRQGLDGSVVVETSAGPVDVSVEFVRVRESRGLVGLGVRRSVVFRHGGNAVKSMDELEASVSAAARQ